MIRRTVCLAALVLAVVPSNAAAQGEDDEFAASSAGHMAFLNQAEGTAILRFVGADGVQAAPEAVTTGYDNPLVAVGARGDAIVVWYDSEKRLWARYRPVGGVLGPQEAVAANVDRFGETNQVALDAAGTATVTWLPETEDDMGGLQVVTRTEPGVWSAPQNLGGYRIFAPELAVTDNGSAVLAWRQSRTPKYPNANQVAVSSRPPGGGAFGPVSILAGVNRDPSSPSVGTNDRGDAVVGWSELHGRDDEFSVHASFRAPGGPFGKPVKLNKTREMAGPWVTVASDGRMVLGWTDNLTRRAEARVRTAAGRLGPATMVTKDLEENSELFPLPVAGGVLAWADRDPGLSKIRLARTSEDGFLPSRELAQVRGFTLGPAFAVTPEGVAMVPRRPLGATKPIRRWWNVL